MKEGRLLVLHADAPRPSQAVNEGIFLAHKEGIVTSASLMVRQGPAAAAAQLAPRHPDLAIGLPIDLGQWEYEGGEWRQGYSRCDSDDPEAVEAECREQLEIFRALLGRDPTHLDSHQHVHENEPAKSVAEALAAALAGARPRRPAPTR